MPFWFVDLITIKLIFNLQLTTSGFYWKYVSEINTTQPAVKLNLEELETDIFDFSVELSAEDIIDYNSSEKCNEFESIEIVLE